MLDARIASMAWVECEPPAACTAVKWGCEWNSPVRVMDQRPMAASLSTTLWLLFLDIFLKSKATYEILCSSGMKRLMNPMASLRAIDAHAQRGRGASRQGTAATRKRRR